MDVSKKSAYIVDCYHWYNKRLTKTIKESPVASHPNPTIPSPKHLISFQELNAHFRHIKAIENKERHDMRELMGQGIRLTDATGTLKCISFPQDCNCRICDRLECKCRCLQCQPFTLPNNIKDPREPHDTILYEIGRKLQLIDGAIMHFYHWLHEAWEEFPEYNKPPHAVYTGYDKNQVYEQLHELADSIQTQNANFLRNFCKTN